MHSVRVIRCHVQGTSSSNILNLLLSETIQKKSAPAPWHRMASPRRNHHDDDDDDDDGANSSVEEDIVSAGTTTDDELAAQPVKLPSCVSVAPGSGTFNRLAQPTSAKTTTTKKYVTFSKDAEIVVHQQSPALGADGGSTSTGKKPDLPGRVSFSTSDVFELDFSDADGDQTPRILVSEPPPDSSIQTTTLNNGKTDGRMSAEATADPLPAQALRNECNNRTSTACCSLNCNNLSAIPKPDHHTSPKKVDNCTPATAECRDESDEIIAEYKREIAKLNRNHEQSIGRICSDNLSANGVQLAQKIINTSDASELPISKPTKQVENVSPVVDNRISIDSSSVVINNYLKTAKELPTIVTTTATNKPPKKSSNIIASNNNTLPPKNNTKPKPKVVSAAAAKSQREDSRLNEFQLDKVESWMSIHQFSDDATAKDALDSTPAPAYPVSSVRRDTPNSKTDDEGMYSYDEQPDGDGSSTYEEIASVLREIEEAKEADQIGDERSNCAAACFQKHDSPNGTNANGVAESPDKMR